MSKKVTLSVYRLRFIIFQAIAMNSVPKTPVTVLQELCTKRGIIPTYQDLPNSATPHAPCFVCEVMCQDFITQGQGKSKKEAKHAAAESMLKMLADEEVVSSPYENKFKENAIGALADYCEEYGLEVPRYEFVREEGPAHDRRFTERCFVGSYGSETTERSKKQAKQVAALQMLTKLKDMVDPRVKEDIRGTILFLVEKIANLGKLKYRLNFSAEDLRIEFLNKILVVYL